tara:strand:- start:78 stop:464 length:387 start_codon:yes stop_codon:yes gene_type:complete
MLKPLPNNSLVAERDRCRYADGDMSLTVWFDENGEIFAFELVFDLLLDEYAVRHTRGKLGKYLNVSEGEFKPGRIQKQVLGSQNHYLPSSRLKSFEDRADNLPRKIREHISESLLRMIAEGEQTKIDD